MLHLPMQDCQCPSKYLSAVVWESCTVSQSGAKHGPSQEIWP